MKKIILFAGLLSSIGLFAAKNAETISHKMQPKETLFKVSLMYNSTVADIEKANPGINPKTVQAGATIKVPKDTKIRDAAFVETFLSDKMAFTPISQIATQIKSEDMPRVRTNNHGDDQLVIRATVRRVADEPETAQSKAADENPFLTPSDIRTGPIADEQPIKDSKVIEPASADKGHDIEDENPFMAPKQKPAKPAAKSTAVEKVTSSNE